MSGVVCRSAGLDDDVLHTELPELVRHALQAEPKPPLGAVLVCTETDDDERCCSRMPFQLPQILTGFLRKLPVQIAGT